MDRRTFLKVAAMTGLAVSAPLGVRRAFAEPAPYKGPFFVLVNASGGYEKQIVISPDPRKLASVASRISRPSMVTRPPATS